MSVEEFVRQAFGDSSAEKIKRVNTGGHNNRKGAAFENYYAVAKICEIGASGLDVNDFCLASQELAFVDDLCLRQYSLNNKTNYQAKNSAGAPAEWNDETTFRFAAQRRIDLEYHQVAESRQVLLVSSKERAAENVTAIPTGMREYCASEHFPYAESSFELLRDCEPLRTNLQRLCDTISLSTIDMAFRLVLGSWNEGVETSSPISVGDFLARAREAARPDIFGALVPERPGLPDWLLNKCAAFQGFVPRTERGHFYINYNGLDVGIPPDRQEPPAEVLQRLNAPEEFLEFLLTLAAEELAQ